eukprot:scpid107288/ scgid27233/ Zinc finger protein ZPR1; Zinc finger protein 259
MPYHFIIDDPSGNSYVQNPHAPANDVYAMTTEYTRTKVQMVEMGFMNESELTEEDKKEGSEKMDTNKGADNQGELTVEEANKMMEVTSKYKNKEDEKEEEKKEEEKKPDQENAPGRQKLLTKVMYMY